MKTMHLALEHPILLHIMTESVISLEDRMMIITSLMTYGSLISQQARLLNFSMVLKLQEEVVIAQMSTMAKCIYSEAYSNLQRN